MYDLLTRLPSIWLIAALSFKVHSATTFALISFIYSIKAFRGFFMWGFFLSVEFGIETSVNISSHRLIKKKKKKKRSLQHLPLARQCRYLDYSVALYPELLCCRKIKM